MNLEIAHCGAAGGATMALIRAWITVAELFSDTMADRLCILEIRRDESPEVDRFADLEEDVSIGQLAGPLDPVDLPLQFEDHFREAFLRRVQIHVLWLPASHLCHMLECRQVDAEPARLSSLYCRPCLSKLRK